MHNSDLIKYAVIGVVVLLVLGLRLRGMSRMRRLRLETLWIIPTIYFAFAAIMFREYPPSPAGWAISAAALLIGAAIGWQRGKLMRIHVDPETHQLNQRASPAAILFIFALIVVRMGARAVLTSGNGTGFHLSTMLITDVLMALAVGLFAATRLEMYLRAKRLLEEARGAQSV